MGGVFPLFWRDPISCTQGGFGKQNDRRIPPSDGEGKVNFVWVEQQEHHEADRCSHRPLLGNARGEDTNSQCEFRSAEPDGSGFCVDCLFTNHPFKILSAETA
jgi:hypothetical protein